MRPAGLEQRKAGTHANRLPIRQRLGRGPCGALQAWPHPPQCATDRGAASPIALALGLERIRLQQLFGRLHVQVVGDVERVHDDADLDRAGFWTYIDVGERNRMGVHLLACSVEADKTKQNESRASHRAAPPW